MTGNISCLDAEQLDIIIRQVIHQYDNGEILVDENAKWDISGAIFFASTVITTIGRRSIMLRTDDDTI